MDEKMYIAIDLKSFYASVECVERHLDPLTTNLVVADPSRTQKTICLAVSPSLKSYGIPGRARLFEVTREVERVNQQRLSLARQRRLLDSEGFPHGSSDAAALEHDPSLRVDFITAPPRMKLYEDYSTRIYSIYLKYVSPEDIHVYSIDECFIDVTCYLAARRQSARQMAKAMISDVFISTGITATAGIGTNMYLAKIALDITAKHAPDFIGELDEMSYRTKLWDHKPITDFWRIGPGTARRLAKYGIYTMGDITLADEDLLYKVFGIDAELLIDHAWGYEPTEIKHIKAYKPKSNSLSRGQVLMRDYKFDEGRLIVKEMMELLSLELVEKGLVTQSVTLDVGYSNQTAMGFAHGTHNFNFDTNAGNLMVEGIAELYDRIVDEETPIRRVYINCNNVHKYEEEKQLNFLEIAREEELSKERGMQTAINEIRTRFGKNAMFKGMDLEEAATTLERNLQIGGHKSGNEE